MKKRWKQILIMGGAMLALNFTVGTLNLKAAETSADEKKVTLECIGGTNEDDQGESCRNLLDGNMDTKWCVTSFSEAQVIWKYSEPVSPSGYKITTGNDNSVYTGRNPKTWYLYGSNDRDAENDGDVWKLIDMHTDDSTLEDMDKKTYEYAFQSAVESYQYYKLYVTENDGDSCMQLTEFELVIEDGTVEYPESGGSVFVHNVQMECIGGTDGTNENENCVNLFDFNVSTKWCVPSFTEAYVIWKAEEPISPTGYTIATCTDSAEYIGRNPKTWYLYGSNDSEAENDADVWELISSTEDDTILEDKCMQIKVTILSEVPEYQYYKLCIMENCGDSCMQISEFDLTYDGCNYEIS